MVGFEFIFKLEHSYLVQSVVSPNECLLFAHGALRLLFAAFLTDSDVKSSAVIPDFEGVSLCGEFKHKHKHDIVLNSLNHCEHLLVVTLHHQGPSVFQVEGRCPHNRSRPKTLLVSAFINMGWIGNFAIALPFAGWTVELHVLVLHSSVSPVEWLALSRSKAMSTHRI